MARKTSARIVRIVTEPLWRRDLLEMRAVNALVSTFGPKRRAKRPAEAKLRTAPKKRQR